jgi:hypothetical protein
MLLHVGVSMNRDSLITGKSAVAESQTAAKTPRSAAVRRHAMPRIPHRRWDRWIADSVILALDMRQITNEQDQALVAAVAESLRELRGGERLGPT